MKLKNYSTSMYIGETTGGIPQPVFYDTHTPIFNDKPPGAVVTGKPGSGKTFFSLTIAAQAAIMGKTTIILDPKGDFLSLKYIENDIGPITMWNLGPGGARSRAGILDPFYMAKDRGETLGLVIDVIELFTGGLTGAELTALSPIIKDVIEMPTPSLLKVVEICKASENDAARNLGTKLDLLAQLPTARLCFAPGGVKRQKLSLNKGTTIITLAGLELPKTPEEAKEGNSNRLITGVLFLIADYIRRLMHNDKSKNPKSLIIDEAWAIISSEQGAKIIKSVALLGRSKSLSLTLITQNASHLAALDIENTITTRFAFGTGQTEAHEIVEDMKLAHDIGVEELLTTFESGECLMQDWRGRYSTVKITNWRESWNEAFASNPLDVQARQAAEAKKKRQQQSA